MSGDGSRLGERSSDRSRSERALADYASRIRPWRRAYALAIVLVVLVALVVVKVAYSHGEISHAKLKTAAAAAPSIALSPPSTAQSQLWTSPDHTAIGTPYWGGTVITYSAHAVSGRDAVTGAVRWSYTRSDRTVCQAAQIQGVTVAVFELNGNCDELTALDSGTGQRKWTRTLDKDGQQLNGHPAYAVGPDTLMLTTPNVIYAISPDGTADQGNGGLDRWVFSQEGCTINSAVLGSAGALISQTCTAPVCTDKSFCGKGPQLLLRDGNAGDTSEGKNPDQIKWNLLGNDARPVSADALISAAVPGSPQLAVLDATNGKKQSTLTLTEPLSKAPTALPTNDAELIYSGTMTYCIASDGTAIRWSAPTASAPTVTATDGAEPPDLPAADIVVTGTDGISLLDGATGRRSENFPVSPPAPGSTAYPFGTGFVVSGPATVVYK